MAIDFSLLDVVTSEGMIETSLLSGRLKVSKTELASAAGLSRDAMSKTARRNAPATQRRLQDLVEIVTRILPWAGGLPQAFAWYRAYPIPSFGDQTAEELVKEGRADAVKAYLARIAVGGFA